MSKERTMLDELFDGNIQPFQNINVKSSEYKQTSKKIDDEKESWLLKLLSEDEANRFDDFETMSSRIAVLEQGEAFKQGFRLGVLLVTEAFYSKNELIDKDS